MGEQRPDRVGQWLRKTADAVFLYALALAAVWIIFELANSSRSATFIALVLLFADSIKRAGDE